MPVPKLVKRWEVDPEVGGRYVEVKGSLQRHLHREPTNGEVLDVLTRIYQDLERHGEVDRILQRAVGPPVVVR